MLGINETKEAVLAVVKLGMAVDKAGADGKIDFMDAALFIDPLMALAPGLTGIDKVPGELGDLDPAEAAELKQYVKDQLDLEDDKLEGVIEDGLGVLLSIYSLVQKIKKPKVEAPAE